MDLIDLKNLTEISQTEQNSVAKSRQKTDARKNVFKSEEKRLKCLKKL